MAEPEPERPTGRTRARRTDIGNLGNLYDALQPTTDTRAKAITNSLGDSFVLVPAGAFRMGAPDEEAGRRSNESPVHEVSITKQFYLAVNLVSQRSYLAVFGKNPAKFNDANGGGSDHPVEMVSHDDAVAYCRLLSARPEEKAAGRTYRLPTEAEWEYACRAGSVSPFSFGATFTSAQGTFDARFPYGGTAPAAAAEGTTPVGKFPANTFALCDMHGNVWEWCADWYDERYYVSATLRDPTGPATGTMRVLRGGSWRNQGDRCRAAYRNALAPYQKDSATGFRMVLEVGEGK